MSNKLSVFVSSVQKELEDERLIVQNLLNTDAFLSVHCVPVLYEFEPASPDKAAEGCLKALDGCQSSQREIPALLSKPGSGSMPFLFPPHRGKGQRLPADAGPDAQPRAG
jgi:hypothetical protein